MTLEDQEEFWKALSRLYDTSVNLVTATERLREIAEAHEKRLDRLEVVQEWLADKERQREKGQS
jgi:hypothetical protein